MIVKATRACGLKLELETRCSRRHSRDNRGFGYGFYDDSIVSR